MTPRVKMNGQTRHPPHRLGHQSHRYPSIMKREFFIQFVGLVMCAFLGGKLMDHGIQAGGLV
jgi:hypothetical protein